MFIPWWGIVLAVVIVAFIIFAVKMMSDDTHGVGAAITIWIGLTLAFIIGVIMIAYWIGAASATAPPVT